MPDEKWSLFISRLVHELRTPLGSVLMLAELLSENSSGALGASEIERTRRIHQATTDVLGLLAEVSELAKIEGGRLGLSQEDVPLMDLAEKLEVDFRPVAREKGLAFEVELGATLPRSIRSDRRRLEQILGSLLTNAFNSTQEGRVMVRIRRAESVPGVAEGVVIAVSDTGREVPETEQGTFFEPFTHASLRSRRQHGGQGLELAVAAALAQRLGGALRLAGREGGGITLTLSLPA